jgi:hypothetical protein
MKSITSLNCLNLEPIIVIDTKGLEAIKHIVSIAPQEAQWFHTLEPETRKAFPGKIFLNLSTKLYIPKQNTDLTQVDSTSSMMVEFYNELKEEYVDQTLINKKLNSMTCWCHSHHNMSPSPSSQDVSQFNTFINSSIDQNQSSWQVMLIFNKKNDFYSRVYDPNTGLVIEGVKIQTNTTYDFSYIDKAAKEKFIKSKGFFFKSKSFANLDFSFEEELASDLVSEIFPKKKKSSKANLTTKSQISFFLDILDFNFNDKELNIFYHLLNSNPEKILNILTDENFQKNKINDSLLRTKLATLIRTTTISVLEITSLFQHVFVLSDLQNLQNCKNYIKENINV